MLLNQTVNYQGSSKTSRITLVDLAGVEKNRTNDAGRECAKEGEFVRKSISQLGIAQTYPNPLQYSQAYAIVKEITVIWEIDLNSLYGVTELKKKIARMEEEAKEREDRYVVQLEIEQKRREDLEAEQANQAAQVALSEHFASFMRQQGYTFPPPGPSSPPGPHAS